MIETIIIEDNDLLLREMYYYYWKPRLREYNDTIVIFIIEEGKQYNEDQ